MAIIKFNLKWDTIKGGDGNPIYAQMDLVAFACDEHDKCVDFVFSKNPSNKYMTYGESDKAQFFRIDTEDIPDSVKYILFVAIINQNAGYADFSVIKKCSVEIRDEITGGYMCGFNVKKRCFNYHNKSLIIGRLQNNIGDYGFDFIGFVRDGNKATLKDWIKIFGAQDTELFNDILASDESLSLQSITSKILFPIEEKD